MLRMVRFFVTFIMMTFPIKIIGSREFILLNSPQEQELASWDELMSRAQTNKMFGVHLYEINSKDDCFDLASRYAWLMKKRGVWL